MGACSVGIRTRVCGRGNSDSAFLCELLSVLSSPSLVLGIFTVPKLVGAFGIGLVELTGGHADCAKDIMPVP